MSTESVSFMLSSEELFYCLRLLEINNIPGLSGEPFGSIEKHDHENKMESAFRALIARQALIFETGKGFRLDKVISTALAICARPEHFIFTSYQSQQELASISYDYFIKGIILTQNNPVSGVFQFQLNSENPPSYLKVLEMINGFSSADSTNDEFTTHFFEISGLEFDNIRNKSLSSPDEAQVLLVKQGFPADQAKDFLGIFVNPGMKATIQVYKQWLTEDKRTRVISVAFAGNNWWIIQSDEKSVGKLKIKKTTQADILQEIESVYSNLCPINHILINHYLVS